MIQLILFYIFAAIVVGAAAGVITARNPVHSVLYLVLAFFTSAALWILIGAEFLGIILVLVYVGAVMVLFLFVVMMLDINTDVLRQGFTRYLPLGTVVILCIVLELLAVLGSGQFSIETYGTPVPYPEGHSNTQELGALLYTVYVYPFEIAAVILLVAIVAAIALTMRRVEGRRVQNPAEQVRVNPRDRIRIVKMPAEKKQ
ncbi:MAG: NADH-quinone oxidoreductase subunit J [Pseudomonadota bacterium]|nr:NADH-quinone oxidoreductase subunit J [Pseudomonadota bacterium]